MLLHRAGEYGRRSGRTLSRDTGLLQPGSVKTFRALLNKYTSFASDRLIFGTDLRFQMARSHKSKDARRRYFPMQAAVYSSYAVSDRLFIEASYNFGRIKYFGQQKWTASMILHPKYSFTQLRVGYFQPSIGTRYDDHTTLPRMIAGADGSPLIAPNFAEYGAEFTYNGIPWLALTAGVFDAASLAENYVRNSAGTVVPLINDEHNPSALGRAEIRSSILDDRLPCYIGSSLYANGNFNLLNVFSGIGLKEKLSVMCEYTRSEKGSVRTTNNVMLDITWMALKGAAVFIRGERGTTDESFEGRDFESYTNQGVIGMQLFIMPSVELRPEYKIVDTEQYRSTRYALQLHLFL